MPVTVSHALSATTPDDPLYEIKPSNWNSGHAVTLAVAGSEISGAFSNANNISFGLSGTAVTASFSVTAPYLTTAMQSNAATISNIRVSAGTASNNLSALTFSNSNGVSFGLNGSVITASAAGGAGSFNISAGTTSGNVDSVVFSNLNGVSFGLDGSTVTASVGAAGGGLTNINVSGGTTSQNLSNIVFSNSNGVSFGLNGSTMTASITPGAAQSAIEGFGVSNTGNTAGNTGISTGIDWILAGSGSITLSQSTAAGAGTVYIQHPAWITTAMASNAATLSNIKVSAGTSSTNLSAITFSNSNGVSFGLNGSTITGSVATSLTNFKLSAGTSSTNLSAVTFSNSNGVSFGLNGSVMTASVDATSSVVAGSNVSISSNGSTITLNAALSISAGTTNDSLYQVVFSNSNGVSFGLNGSTITASAAAGAGAGISAGTQSVNTGTVVFSNSNGITFGMSGSSRITASHNGLTTAMASNAATISNINVSAGTTSNNLSNLVFSNANGVSFGLNGSTVTGSITPGAAQSAIEGFGVSNTGNTAGNTGISTGIDWVLAGSGSITLSQSTAANSATIYIQHPAWLTTAMASNAATISNINVSAGTTSNNLSAVVFSNSNGVSFGLNGSTVTASAAAGAGGVGISAGTQSVSTGTMVFSNSNGVTFGMSGSSRITASVAGQTASLYGLGNTTQNSSTALALSVLSLNGLGAMTVGYSNGSVQLSAPASSSLVGTNGVSISSDGSTISAMLEPQNFAIFPLQQQLVELSAPAAGSLSIQFIQNMRRISASRVDMLFNWIAGSSATTNTMAIALTALCGIYTRNGSTLSSIASGSTQTTYSYASNTAGTAFTANFTAIRPISVPVDVDISPGVYYVAMGWSTAASSVGLSTTNLGQTLSIQGGAGQNTATNYAEWGAATATSKNYFNGMGIYSATITTVPGTIALSAINQTGAALSRANIGLIFRG